MNRDEMIRLLNQGKCYIRFVKVNSGENRLMVASLNGKFIPPEKFPTNSGSPNEETIRCFDLVKDEWRSFRVDSVKEFMSINTINLIEEADLHANLDW